MPKLRKKPLSSAEQLAANTADIQVAAPPVEEPAVAAVSKSTPAVRYPDFEVHVRVGDTALTWEDREDFPGMKTLLGWESEADATAKAAQGVTDPKRLKKLEVKFGEDYDFLDPNGDKVRLRNNPNNRRIDLEWCSKIEQIILNRHWEFNGQPLQFGRAGEVISAQHRGVGYGFAVLRWHKDQDRWLEKWPTEPTIDTEVQFGLNGTGPVLDTIDYVKPRSLADVIYTDPTIRAALGQVKPKDVMPICKAIEYAIRFLWARTGATADAYAPKLTHTEAKAFLHKHLHLLRCVKHLYSENNGESVTRYLPLGTAAGMLYLMASSTSDGDQYHHAVRNGEADETLLDWANLDKAEEFWVLLAGGDAGMLPVLRLARPQEGDLKSVEVGGGMMFAKGGTGGSIAERTAVLCKAWGHFLGGHEITTEDVTLRYDLKYIDDAENKFVKRLDSIRLLEWPTAGGIDLGEPHDDEPATVTEATSEEEAAAAEPPPAQPTASEQAKAERQRRIDEHNARVRAKQAAQEGLTDAGRKAQQEQVANGKPAITPAASIPSPKPARKPTKIQQQQTAKARKADEEAAKNKS